MESRSIPYFRRFTSACLPVEPVSGVHQWSGHHSPQSTPLPKPGWDHSLGCPVNSTNPIEIPNSTLQVHTNRWKRRLRARFNELLCIHEDLTDPVSPVSSVSNHSFFLNTHRQFCIYGSPIPSDHDHDFSESDFSESKEPWPPSSTILKGKNSHDISPMGIPW